MLQRCSCLSSVATYLLALFCRGAAVLAVLKPICLHCVAGMQLFKWCRNLSAGTVLQRGSCLSGVETYLPTLCCRGAAVSAVSQPICRHCAAGVQLFKQCPNLSAGTVLQGCSCLSDVGTYLPGTVLQGCSCLSSVATYLPGLCCSCLSGVGTYLPGTVVQAVYMGSQPTFLALSSRGAGCLRRCQFLPPVSRLEGTTGYTALLLF